MGLFDKKMKKPTDLDDEVQSQPPQPQAAPAVRAAGSAAPLDAGHPDYGINKAIELMRMLPNDNIELVVRVVKTTLESTNIKVATIIKDAARKQAGIESRVDVLKKEIVGLESQIATRRGEIGTLEADHKETSMVKDRLVLAEKLTGSGNAAERPIAPAAPAAVVPRPATPSVSPDDPARVDPRRNDPGA